MVITLLVVLLLDFLVVAMMLGDRVEKLRKKGGERKGLF
jgi:hypothetical protein